ncbi:MAG: hypothetical protein JO297_17835 [Nitrososphaeraceae archaeon]|nr:hypothetical protein [Nitrososphaeraceae archaeon]
MYIVILYVTAAWHGSISPLYPLENVVVRGAITGIAASIWNLLIWLLDDRGY